MTTADVFGLIGYFGLSGGFILCVIIILASIYLTIRKNPIVISTVRILIYVQTFLIFLAVISLGFLLQINAFEYSVVFNAVDLNMPWFQKLGGLWSGQASSLLFWSFVMSCIISLGITISKKMENDQLTPFIMLILEFMLIFFILPDLFFANPFDKLWMLPSGTIEESFSKIQDAVLVVAKDGQGMNPSLRHIAMLSHPPTLYIGLIGFFLPFSFGLSTLVKNKINDHWIKLIYPFVVISWLFLTIGMLLGSWWAYTILGWGGYWGWDAVEISGLLPWLLSFGMVHSMSPRFRGKNSYKWAYIFSSSTILFILLGILITRSGILESVHAYASGAMGPVLTFLLLSSTTLVVFLLWKRWKNISDQPLFKAKNFHGLILLLFNIVLMLLVILFLFGQTLPLTSQLLPFLPENFEPAQYEKWSSFLLLIMMVLTGLSSLAEIRKQSVTSFNRILTRILLISFIIPIIMFFKGLSYWYALLGFWAVSFVLIAWLFVLYDDILKPAIISDKKKPRWKRVGYITLHIGLAIMAFGIIGVENYAASFDIDLKIKEPVEVAGYSLTLDSFENFVKTDGNVRFQTKVSVERNNFLHLATPALEHYSKIGTFYAIPSIGTRLNEDIQIVLKNLPAPGSNSVKIHVTIFPLMAMIWLGGSIISVSGFLSLFLRLYKNKR